METIALLSFLTDKYKEAELEEDRKDISTLYWTVLDYSLHGYISSPARSSGKIITPILN